MNMKKIVGLSMVASAFLYANDVYKLDEVVTIGTKTASSVSDLPMQVAVIGAEDIENSGASNVVRY